MIGMINMDWTLTSVSSHFDSRLDGIMRQAARLLLPDSDTSGMLAHLLAQKGKRIRPTLVLGTHLAFGGDGEAALPLAAAVELIHHASLIHDDIEDMDEFRRGQPSLWKRFGVRQALNLGDLLLPAGFFLFLESPIEAALRVRVLTRISRELMKLVEGQMTEIAGLNQEPSGWSGYRGICAGKTGALFRVCLVCPAELCHSLEGNPYGAEEVVSLSLLDGLGTQLGQLFQSRDDLIDVTGRKEGRYALGDLLEGKLSLLTVLASERLTGAARREFFTMHTTPRPRKDEAMASRMRGLLFAEGIVDHACLVLAQDIERFHARLGELRSPGLKSLLEDLLRRLSLDPESEKQPPT
jgi:geranylgeranyl pyrophosphate synthase